MAGRKSEPAPVFTGGPAADHEVAARQLAALREQLADLPPKPARTPEEQTAAEALLTRGHAIREAFLTEHAEAVYETVTNGFRTSLRVGELVDAVALRFPELVPSRAQLAAHQLPLKDRDSLEIAQGIFLAQVLARPRTGHHLLHAMAQPRQEALDLLDTLLLDDAVDLGVVHVQRKDNVGHVTVQNHSCLNAEDDASTAALETAVDLVLLDDRIEAGVLRGGPATHPKYAGRRVFSSGINLTHLYHGRISLTDFFLERELGVVNKLYRGHDLAPPRPDALESRHEKPWIGAVDSFAIGGGCQFLLVLDRVVAETGAYFNLPAGKEGIIPGCGVMRLPRFLGEGPAREAVLFNRDFPVDSPDGRRLVAEVVDPAGMDDAIARAADQLMACGLPSVRANRRAMRLGAEPLDLFRTYMAHYARDQAYCAHSDALIHNLERTWSAHRRRPK
ncbi:MULTISPECIES: enoyl-CoA hydratase/isomerase family protein [Streptomyces]|uniref:enoyl-CoA hydratase/isomerase family protein n=1 Tax=Streptomyces TaxID=1883 RepID=UPI001558DEFA|nr:enoyl-CoA hydratase/isomerase family protein [Streptomyces kasugaensis]